MNYNNEYWNCVELATRSIPDYKKLFGKTIMITGANGMICSSVVEILHILNVKEHADIKILVAGRSEERMKERFKNLPSGENSMAFVYYDATDHATIETDYDIDCIIHGASNANPAIYMREPVETILANILGLSKILELAKEKRAERVLYISSSEVYGQKNTMDAFSEGDYGYVDILSQRAAYPTSKRTGEALCVAYGMEYGVSSVIVRPGHIYGPTITPRDNRATAQFARAAKKGDNIVMNSAGEQRRSYCYNLDCASAILTVLIEGEDYEAYNISNKDSICTIREIAEEIADAANVDVCFKEASETTKKSYNPMMNSSLNSEKLEALGWRAAFTLQDGVSEMMKVIE